MLIDTHVHLCAPIFDDDRDAVLQRARRAGVGAVVTVSENLAEAETNLELARRYDRVVYPAAGLFPTTLDLQQAESLEGWIRRHRESLVAIGEVGLDHWKVQDPAERELQAEIFGRFVDLSVELDLPLNVHSRSAGRQTLELLLSRGAKRVQMHAFDGRAAKALPGVDAGFFFSVPPSVVRSAQKRKLVSRLPLESLLLETDSPVLGPEPAARNEPANVTVSLQAIAEIKSLPPAEVATAVTENTLRLYGRSLLPDAV